MKKTLTHVDLGRLVQDMHEAITASMGAVLGPVSIYPIPRGGIPVAYLLKACDPIRYRIVDTPVHADMAIDDIVASGATRDRIALQHDIPLYALIDKTVDKDLPWFVFPWEVHEEEGDEGIEDNVRRIIEYIGEDVSRPGLLETPRRVKRAWEEWTSGYGKDPADVLKVFEDGAEGVDEMVIVKDIPVYSKCEHHLADIFGIATIAYIPSGKIVGLSKLSRLVDLFARRLQVQERLTTQIADALQKHLDPVGVGVIIKARHMCMESRGICQTGSVTITSATRGVMRNDSDARQEFLKLADSPTAVI